MTEGTLVNQYNRASKFIEDYESGAKTIEEIRNDLFVHKAQETANRNMVAIAITAARTNDETKWNNMYKMLMGTGKQNIIIPNPKSKLVDRTVTRGHGVK